MLIDPICCDGGFLGFMDLSTPAVVSSPTPHPSCTPPEAVIIICLLFAMAIIIYFKWLQPLFKK